MLNGKFYTGLPEKMMNRGPNGIDRQRTNFYLPEEENSPSIHEYSPSRYLQGRRPSASASPRESSSRTSSISYDSQNSFCDDVNTRDLVRKQQQSKIQFYDYDNSYEPPSRTITPSSVGRNFSRESPEADVSQRKLETLKSRIDFYDYVDEGALKAAQKGQKEQRNGGGVKPAVARQLPRESETRSVVINKARDSDNFVQETCAPEDNRRTDGRSATKATVNHSLHTAEGHLDSPKKPVAVRRVPIELPRPSQDKSSTSSSNGGGGVQKSHKQLSTSVIDLSTLDLDDPEMEELKKLKPPTKNDIHKKLATFQTEVRVVNHNNNKNSNNHNNNHHYNTSRADGRSVVDSYDSSSPPRSSVISPSQQRQATTTEPPPNEARRNAHRHLQSSFSFGATTAAAQPPPHGQADGLTGGARRANSIRDTAVCRVGVGLPDLV